MDRKDIDQESKKEFSSKVNEQAGRTSKREVFQTKHMTIDQKNSWNEFGYILIPNFVDEKFCDEMNKEVINIIKSIIPEESAFSHAYVGDGHIAIREMKPTQDPKSIEDEISKLFRIHSRGIFNEFINNQVLCDILEDILGPNVDCFLSQFIKKLDKKIINKVTIFDVYEGEKIDNQSKGIAIRVQLQPLEKTFSDEEIESFSNQIIDTIITSFGATLRK